MRRLTFAVITAILLFAAAATGAGGACLGTFVDKRDGKKYKTVVIGGKMWMGENLNYNQKGGSWCYKKDEANCAKYGRLYDWNTALAACPAGFHLPTAGEWDKLEKAMGGGKAGKNLKAESGWESKGGGTDACGFSALPGGNLGENYSGFYYAGYYGGWWTSAEAGEEDAYFRLMDFSGDNVERGSSNKEMGRSVRCAAD